MISKLVNAFGLLRKDVAALKDSVQRIEVSGEYAKDGLDGVSPDPGEIVSAVLERLPAPKDGVSPSIKEVAAEAAKLIPEPRPGRDAVPLAIRDVADLVLSNIRTPKDGVSPDPGQIAVDAAKLIPRPKDGVSPTPEAVARSMPNPQRGKTGAPGKNGVSVTDVQLNNNELFVFLDGKKNKVGKIKFPAASAPFNPGNAGGGGSSRGINRVAENIVVVNSLSDLIKPGQTRILFRANTQYHFSNRTTIESSFEADFEDSVALTGALQAIESYRYTGTGTAFNAVGSRIEFRNFGYGAPNGTVFDILNSPTVVLSFTTCVECEHVGTISGVGGVAAFNLFDSVFFNIKSSGLKTPGNFLVLALREALMITSSTGVTLWDWSNSTLNDFEIANFEAQAPAGSFVFDGDAGSVNINPGRVATIRDSSLSTIALGNALGPGLDSDDAGYQYENSTVIDSRAVGFTYVTASAATPVDDGVDVQISGTFADGSESSQASSDSLGNITMLNRISKRGMVSINLDLSKASGSSQDYLIKIRKRPGGGGPVDVEGVATTVTLSGGGSAQIAISGPTRFIEGDEYFASIRGVGTSEDITANTQGFEVSE